MMSGVARTEFVRKSRKILKSMPGNTSKLGATLKGKNLLPEEGAKFFPLRKIHNVKSQICYANATLL